MSLLEAIAPIPLVDQHAHNLVRAEVMEVLPYAAAFTEGRGERLWMQQAQHSLCYHRSLVDIASLLGCEATESAIRFHRQAMGLEALTRLCFEAAHLEAIVMDDGFLPETILPLDWHQPFAPTYRLLRLEWLAEQLIAQSTRFDVFLEWFRSELDPLPAGVVGFKSIAAYRTGLDLHPMPVELAAEGFYQLKAESGDRPLRLMHKPLIDFLVHEAVAIAAQHQIPVQFHCGFGDADLDLRLANPLHLRVLLENPRCQGAPIVLLHAAYPFMREAGYLASVYSNVYVDFGLAVPLLSVAGMRQTLALLLELSPTTKLLYSSDAHLIPELYYLGAKWGRQILAQVLEDSIQAGEITASIAEAIAQQILRQNAIALYGLS